MIEAGMISAPLPAAWQEVATAAPAMPSRPARSRRPRRPVSSVVIARANQPTRSPAGSRSAPTPGTWRFTFCPAPPRAALLGFALMSLERAIHGATR